MRAPKIAYLSGPVDAAEVYQQWTAGSYTKLFGTSYLMQFYDLCSEIGAEALVITTLPGSFSRRKLGNVTIENRPPPTSGGLRYHLGMFWFMFALAPALFQFRPSAFVITANQNYWFCLVYVKLMGTEIIPSAHCVMWPPYLKSPLHFRLLLFLDGLFLRWFVRWAMAVSDVAGDQVKALAKNERLQVSILRPTYERDQFDGIAPPDHARRPFRVLFTGRAETNKGVYDLVAVAERMNGERPGQFHFDVCGDGSEFERLQKEVVVRGLEGTVHVHGFCERKKLHDLLSDSHIIVAPTRSDFEEGLPKSIVEAVLAGRPFVASPVCPMLVPLGDAAIEVPPDDAMAYHDAIIRLADDPALYQEKTEACLPLQPQFYDTTRSYKTMLRQHLFSAGIIQRPKLTA